MLKRPAAAQAVVLKRPAAAQAVKPKRTAATSCEDLPPLADEQCHLPADWASEYEALERAFGIREHGKHQRVSTRTVRNAFTKPAMLLCTKLLALARRVNTCVRSET